MIKAGINDKDNPVLVAGLTQENIDRLKKYEPIKITLESFGVKLSGTLLIMYGETTEHIEQQFREAGLINSKTKIIDGSDI